MTCFSDHNLRPDATLATSRPFCSPPRAGYPQQGYSPSWYAQPGYSQQHYGNPYYGDGHQRHFGMGAVVLQGVLLNEALDDDPDFVVNDFDGDGRFF